MDRSDRFEENLKPNFWAGKKIGLLGGSFNPAHDAHVEISVAALEKLKLDYVWWVVSPQNPLKDSGTIAPLEKRLEWAKEKSTHAQIFVTDIEAKIQTRYTVDTIKKITSLYPESHFVWLMGADNLEEFDQWRDWKEISNHLPIAVFDRPLYSTAKLSSKAACSLRAYEIEEKRAAEIAKLSPPVWVFCRGTDNPISATEVRKTHAFFRNNK